MEAGSRVSFGSIISTHRDALFVAYTPFPPVLGLLFPSSPGLLREDGGQWQCIWNLNCLSRVQTLSLDPTSIPQSPYTNLLLKPC